MADWNNDDLKREESSDNPEEGIGLCLSGGGYRAMLYHAGALIRLNEFGLLRRVRRISSVSGGSIIAATLGLHWDSLKWDANFERIQPASLHRVIGAVRRMASETIDADSVFWGGINPFDTITEKVVRAYEKHLFGNATLQSLPDERCEPVDGRAAAPRFVLTATNVKTGSLWRFAKPYMADYRVGIVDNPALSLAVAVAASSAFPPVLSPVKVSLDGFRFRDGVPEGSVARSLRGEAVLTDGGVYDNLGLEPVFKRYKTVLVSDGGKRMADSASPSDDWARHSYRLIELLGHQTASLRLRQLMAAFNEKRRAGAYWGIRTDIARYAQAGMLDCPTEVTLRIANTPTRLAAVDEDDQKRIMNWGYAVCDAAIRCHLEGYRNFPPPSDFPFAAVGLE